MSNFRISLAVLLLGALSLLDSSAQTNPPIAQNPLMQLMQSQPSVDINSPIVVKVEFDPPAVAVGEKSVYRVTLNGLDASVNWPQEMPAPKGLHVTPSARGQIFQPLGNVLRPLTALNFHVTAERPGLFTMPAFLIDVYGKPVAVPEAYLEVAPTMEPDHRPSRQLRLQPERTNIFIGETLRVRVISPGIFANIFESMNQLQFNGDGFLADKTDFRQTLQHMEINGQNVPVFAVDAVLTPIAAGPQKLAAQAFTGGSTGPIVISGQVTIQGGIQRQYVLLDSDPVNIDVRPLPPEGAPAGFTGFIGKLSVERQVSTNALRVGDAIRLLVTFRSDANLNRLVPPPPPAVDGWQIFPAIPVETPASAGPMTNNTLTFAYTLLALTEEAHQTPAIPFGSFDPEKAAYADLQIAPMNVSVSAEGLPSDWKVASRSTTDTKREQKPSLSKLAESPGATIASLTPHQIQGWFFFVQLAPAALLIALGLWARRRNYLEQHPEIVRCRQARRALRRQRRALRQAAATGDAPGFVRNGVAALQIAASPHFPATPRALVCGDVLNLFEPAERTGRTGEVITSFFSHEQAESFAPQRENHTPLFDLKPDLENILEKMEARL